MAGQSERGEAFLFAFVCFCCIGLLLLALACIRLHLTPSLALDCFFLLLLASACCCWFWLFLLAVACFCLHFLAFAWFCLLLLTFVCIRLHWLAFGKWFSFFLPDSDYFLFTRGLLFFTAGLWSLRSLRSCEGR